MPQGDAVSTRQIDPERVLSVLAAREHTPAVHQCNGLDDCQPQPVIGAAVAA